MRDNMNARVKKRVLGAFGRRLIMFAVGTFEHKAVKVSWRGELPGFISRRSAVFWLFSVFPLWNVPRD